jgi:hypothetical protein
VYEEHDDNKVATDAAMKSDQLRSNERITIRRMKNERDSMPSANKTGTESYAKFAVILIDNFTHV